MPIEDSVDTIKVDEELNQSSSDGSGIDKLFPGAKVSSEKDTPNLEDLISNLPPRPQGGRGVKERDKILDKLSQEYFTDEEEKKWDRDLRRAIIAFKVQGYLDLVDVPEDVATKYPELGGKRIVVFDTDRCQQDKSFPWGDILKDAASFGYVKDKIRKPQVETFLDFSDKLGKVYSKGDLQLLSNQIKENKSSNELVRPRDLFYSPKGNPIDPEVIKKEVFYVFPWEVAGVYPENYPLKNLNRSFDFEEVAISALVFHSEHGNGKRDELGVLNVKYPNGEVRRISGRFFVDSGYTGRGKNGVNGILTRSPRTYFEDFCPDIAEAGTIRPEDFVARGGEGGVFESKRVMRNIGEGGRIMVDSTLYLLGEKYHKDTFLFSKLSPEYGCILSTSKWGDNTHYSIERVFKLVPENEREALKLGRSYAVQGKNDIAERGIWSPETFIENNPQAKKLVEQWEDYLRFSSNLEDLGVRMVSLSVREQASLWELFSSRKTMNLRAIVNLEKLTPSNRTDRIRSLTTVARDIKDISKIIKIGKEQGAEFLFENVAAITERVGEIEDLISRDSTISDVEEDRIRQINDMILMQTSKIFLATHEVSSKYNDISVQDVTNALYRFRRDVDSWYSDYFLRGNASDSKYLQLLNLFDKEKEGSNMQTLLLSMIESFWTEDIVKESKENKSSLDALNRIKEFYNGNKELFNTSSETTGDTEVELFRLKEFFDQRKDTQDLVLDLACGDRKRITEPMADMLQGKAKVLGLDIWSPGENTKENLNVVEGSIDSIPLADRSVGTVTLNWSPPNDWVGRNEQIINLGEISRVIKLGGVLRADIPFLEGGQGSWLEDVERQYKEGKEKYGDVNILFPGGRAGEFHIYPLAEFKALLTSAGFSDINYDFWKTKSGKPRVAVTAEYTGNKNPVSQIF